MEERTEVVSSLLQGVVDGENNCGAIAQLLGKLLLMLLQDLMQEKSDDINNVTASSEDTAKKNRDETSSGTFNTNDKCPSHALSTVTTISNHEHMDKGAIPPGFHDWLKVWINPMASALLSPNRRGRSQVAAFCLPLIVPISLSDRSYASLTMESLISELVHLSFPQTSPSELAIVSTLSDSTFEREVYLWAFLECAQYASSQKLILCSPQLRQFMSKCLPLHSFKVMLVYSNQSLRLAGFLAIEALVPCYVSESDDVLDTEVAVWKFALPYASKSNDKGYTKNLMDCLSRLLRRLYVTDQSKSTGIYLQDFVCNFLVDGVALQIGLYPGTAAEKEYFSLSLVKTVVAFAFGIVDETGKHYASKILNHLVCQLSSLLFLIHSTWDITRATAFEIVCDIVRWALENSMMLPVPLSDERQRLSLFFRAIHLASSPRQREADSGAKILGLLFISASTTASARIEFFRMLLSLVTDRLGMFETALGKLNFFTNETSASLSATPESTESFIPLAHGLLNALNVILGQAREKTFSMALEKEENDSLCQQLAFSCRQAILCSMNVVAHIENFTDESEDDYDFDGGLPQVNVNTGALGANTSFSLLHKTTEEENTRRVRIQRVVVSVS